MIHDIRKDMSSLPSHPLYSSPQTRLDRLQMLQTTPANLKPPDTPILPPLPTPLHRANPTCIPLHTLPLLTLPAYSDPLLLAHRYSHPQTHVVPRDRADPADHPILDPCTGQARVRTGSTCGRDDAGFAGGGGARGGAVEFGAGSACLRAKEAVYRLVLDPTLLVIRQSHLLAGEVNGELVRSMEARVRWWIGRG